MTAHFADIRAILFDILGPILALVLLGALMRRKFAVDVGTLSRLTLYLFTPAFMFDQVANSSLSSGEMGGVMLLTMVQILTLGVVVWMIGRVFHVRRQTLAAIALTVMFYNSGNYGLPLAKLAFPGTGSGAGAAHDGGAVQTFVALMQNILTFTVGLWITSMASGQRGLHGLWRIVRLPFIPTIAAALLARWWLRADTAHHLPILIGQTAHYLSDGLVPVALITLGAQLAVSPRWPRWGPVSVVLFLRLILGPVQMLGLLYLLHRIGWRTADLWPWPAQLIILTSGTPTAINTLILTLEIGGDAELTADCVFWTTVMSCLTITGWLIVVRWGM
jgi:hypothetical protein